MSSDKSIVARPYAKAMFEVARVGNTVEAVSEALKVAAYMVSTPAFVDLIKHPKFSQKKAVAWMVEMAGNTFSESIQQLLRLLSENRRLLYLPEIKVQYEELRRNYESTVEATVVSAFPLSEKHKEGIVNALKRRLNVTEVKLSCDIDSSLLAGAIVRARDWVIDGTVRGRLNRVGFALGL